MGWSKYYEDNERISSERDYMASRIVDSLSSNGNNSWMLKSRKMSDNTQKADRSAYRNTRYTNNRYRS